MLRIKFSDLLRSTLPVRSGNEGWIGVSPHGDKYHVVVPVDTQIARGVMACNRPTDGTPFGGYANWLYFRCLPFEYDGEDEADFEDARTQKVRETGRDVVVWLASYGVEAEVDDSGVTAHEPARLSDDTKCLGAATDMILDEEDSRRRGLWFCPGCGKSWERLGTFLLDPDVQFDRYRACLDDFPRGVFVFIHRCGRTVEVPVSRFVGRSRAARNLAGTHACPGMCYHESSLASCSAVCDGSTYRRIARRLRSG